MAKANGIGFLYLFLSLLFQSAAFGIGKQAALTIESFTLFNVLSNPFYLASIGCLGFHAIVWQLVLRIYPLSFAYFFMSLVFVNILLISHLFFDEAISINNILGSAVIMAGVLILSRDYRVVPVD